MLEKLKKIFSGEKTEPPVEAKTVDEKIENPESINEYAMKAKLLYEAKSKISKNIYTDSINYLF